MLKSCPFCHGEAKENNLRTAIKVLHKFNCMIKDKDLFPNNEYWVSRWENRPSTTPKVFYRDIKFRGLVVGTKEWVYGYLIVKKEITKESKWVDTQSYRGWSPPVHDVERINYWIVCNGDFENPIEVDGKTVGQYVGLKDRDGIEIYEDDVLGDGTVGNHVVIFIAGCFMVKHTKGCCKGWTATTINTISHTDKIIGNIHQNHELLEAKQ